MMSHNRIAMIAVVFGCAVGLATATDYTFRVTDGKWNVANNWEPPTGIPGEFDTATILTGQTCRIEDRDESINKLTVQGTLRLIGHTLSMGGAYTGTQNLTVDGLMQAEGQSRFLLKYPLQYFGSGAISATGSGNHLDLHTLAGTPIRSLFIGDEGGPHPTIKGNVSFLVHVCNNGQVVVDATTDVMDIGSTDPNSEITLFNGAEGYFKITGGRMLFWKTRPQNFRSEWRVEGGTLQLTEYATSLDWAGTFQCLVRVRVRAGALELKNPIFRTYGGLNEFSGGLIRVAPTTAVAFVKA